MHPHSERPEIRDRLDAAEARSTALSAALLAGQPELIASAANGLQQATRELALAVGGLRTPERLDAALKQRLRSMAHVMAMQREACLRRAAVVERSLHSIIPATRSSTYQANAGPYGQQARRSGAFKLVSG